MEHSSLVASSRRPLLLLAAWAAAGLLAASPAVAAEEVLTLDAAKSKLTFLLDATAHEVKGSLALERGEVRFDRATGTAGGEIVIDARRTATGSEGRDEKMHAEVLLSAKFPQIVFRPEKLEGQLPASGQGTIGLRGKISLAGVEHDLLLPAEVEIDGDRVVASSTFKIPFVAWGLHDPSIFLLKVAKEVVVTLRVEGRLAPAP